MKHHPFSQLFQQEELNTKNTIKESFSFTKDVYEFDVPFLIQVLIQSHFSLEHL